MALAGLFLVGCSTDGGPKALPRLQNAPLTDTVTLALENQRFVVPDSRNSAIPSTREEMVDEGLGDEYIAEGEAHMTRAEDGTPPPPGPNARMLVRFVHLADMQITDDESPTRVAATDTPGVTASAYRPQDVYSCTLTNAMVRTINSVHRRLPLDFVIMGGDNIDNAQQNELDWVLGLLDGSPSVECDSGEKDDIVPGPGNDPKDPIRAQGLDMPWYWVTGNHDVLVQGNFVVNASREDAVLGSYSALGTRDWSREGGPVTAPFYRNIVPDPRRAHITGSELLAQVMATGDGHGITQAQVDTGRADYYFDVPGTRLRFIVWDSSNYGGSADGFMPRHVLEDFILPALDGAAAEDKWAILSSHHAASYLSDGGSFGGMAQEDAVLPEEWIELLTSHPAVLFNLAGHSHAHRIHRLEGERPVWEIVTSAVLDYPHQSRVMEIWNDDNGFLRVRSTVVDFSTEGDPIAAEGRTLGVLDYVVAWSYDGHGTPADRNVEIHIPIPAN